MKAHVGVDSKAKSIHTAVATAANVADSAVLPDLLHGEETRVWGDQAYRGQTEVIRECAPQAQDCIHRRYRYKNRVDENVRGGTPTEVRTTQRSTSDCPSPLQTFGSSRQAKGEAVRIACLGATEQLLRLL